MSGVYEYARGEGWTSSNPFRGVKRNIEHPSTEEVSSELLARTLDRAPPHLLPLLALAYLWGMRQTDMRNLTFDAVEARAVRWQESKTHKKNQQEITSSVAYFLQMAADYREQVARRYEKAAAKLAANGPVRCVRSVTSFCPPVGVPGPKMACSARSIASDCRSNSGCFVPRPRPTHKRRTCSATWVSCVRGTPVPAGCRRFDS